jgi:putative membrane protein
VTARTIAIIATKLLINALALLVADALLEKFHFQTAGAAFWAAIVLAFVNTYLRPLVLLLTLPLNIVTLGLFTLIVNALMLFLVSWLVPGFVLEGFWTAVLSALIISIVSVTLNLLLNPRPIVHIHYERHDPYDL